MLKISAFLFNTSVDSLFRMSHPRHSVAVTYYLASVVIELNQVYEWNFV